MSVNKKVKNTLLRTIAAQQREILRALKETPVLLEEMDRMQRRIDSSFEEISKEISEKSSLNFSKRWWRLWK